ncbi:MAG: hypothetical protein OEZ39_02045 [Gammaproteobacteria bacterium]|nr:hypothetical protein [Gammaproteobacteria bacterium]MDH5650636.1 hypothetical protein [Gammaproteobacteria bacterium]
MSQQNRRYKEDMQRAEVIMARAGLWWKIYVVMLVFTFGLGACAWLLDLPDYVKISAIILFTLTMFAGSRYRDNKMHADMIRWQAEEFHR